MTGIAILLIGFYYKWEYALITFGIWFITLFVQFLTGPCVKNLRTKDSGLTDERLRLVGDLVGGARTIKCYGWEEKYVDKIKHIRDKQTCNLIKFNMLAHLGNAIYQNMGLICILFIFLHKWYN